MTFDEFFAMFTDAQYNYCSLTPWYDFPDGLFSNKDMMPDVHYEAAQAFAKKYDMPNVSYSLDVTYDLPYYVATMFEEYEPQYESNTTINST